ncbi:MAG: hypothetical protein ABIH18_02295 [Candidatus Omnitrophota bacterium]
MAVDKEKVVFYFPLPVETVPNEAFGGIYVIDTQKWSFDPVSVGERGVEEGI